MAELQDVKDYTEDCERCKKANKIGKDEWYDDFTIVHTEQTVLCGEKLNKIEKEKKAKYVYRIAKSASALRNTKGGKLIVHLKGERPINLCRPKFNEAISERVGRLLEDGHSYDHAISIRNLSEIGYFSVFDDFILLNISKGHKISTADYKTKVRNDHQNLNAQAPNVARILFGSHLRVGEEFEYAFLRGLECELQENRNIELKAVEGKVIQTFNQHKDNPSGVAEYIWNDLKLKDNVTSMSKVENGGSLFVGIAEEQHVPVIKGFHYDHIDELKRCVRQKVIENCSTLRGRTFAGFPDDLLKIEAHELVIGGKKRYVLEISVGKFNGIAFYKRSGPAAYVINKQRMSRIDRDEWVKLFEKDFRSTVN